MQESECKEVKLRENQSKRLMNRKREKGETRGGRTEREREAAQ